MSTLQTSPADSGSLGGGPAVGDDLAATSGIIGDPLAVDGSGPLDPDTPWHSV